MISHRARRAAVGLAAAAMVLLGAGTSSAHLSAESPVSVEGPTTDPGGVLGNRTGEVRAALDEYFDTTGQQLFVVFVPTFDGLAGQDWATASAARSDLANQDILLAVATEDRASGYSVDDEQQLSDGDLQRVEREAILPRLRQEDWAGAAIAAAQGYADAAEGGGFPWVPVGLGGAAVAGAGALLVRRRRRGHASTGDLDRQCAAALVRVDNTLTTSEQELAFAEAQFGTEATQSFRQVLTAARETTQSAFALRQQLDDGQPESPAEHQRIATEVLALCESVETMIAEQVAGFDTLRDLQANAPDLLAAVPARAAEITQRLTTSRVVLERLRADHPRAALASVEGNVDQAERLATESVQQAQLGTAAVAADDRATAVVHAMAAEEGLGQATTLLDALDRADADIAAAPQQIAERIAAIRQDVDDAARLAGADPAVASAVDTAREAVTHGGEAGHDPLEAVRRLQTAEADLDELLAPVRAAAAEAEKARVALSESLGRVTSRVQAVSDYIDTRRGAVGADARTRLSEAARHLGTAQELVLTDPAAALDALTQAEHQVDDAERRAQSDVRQWEANQRDQSSGSSSGSVLGGIGSGSSSRRRSSSSSRSKRSSSTRRSSSRRTSSGGSRGRRGGGGRF